MADVYGKIAAAQPNLKEGIDKVKKYAEEKLFHPLIEQAFPLIQEMKDANLALELFTKDVKPIGGKLNPVRYMELVGQLMKKCFQGKSGDQKLAFLEENFAPFDVIDEDSEESSKDKDGDTKMGDAQKAADVKKKKQIGGLSHYSKASESDFRDAKALFLSFKARVLLEGGKVEEAKDVMDKLEDDLFKKRQTVSIKPNVFSWFYAAQLFLYHATQNSSSYYRAGVNFIRYTPLTVAATEFDLAELALNLGISALISPGEFNFGELLETPLYKQDDVKKMWIYDMVFAFQEGKYDLYDKCMKAHSAEIGKIKVLKDNEAVVYEKFCSAVLMEFAFRQPKSKRTVTLAELAKEIRVKDVESLLINAMCANLIRGVIDEVEGTFCYSWVKPRVLDMGRLKVLEDRVGAWIDQQQSVLRQVEEMTPELLVTV